MDCTAIFGGPFLVNDNVASAEEQLRQAMLDAGVLPPSSIHIDGILHRFSTNGKKDDDAGWYVANDGFIPFGAFGDWRSSETITFRGNIGRPLTPTEDIMVEANLAEAKRQRDADKKKRNDVAADAVLTLWEASEPAPANFPYLVRKGVGAHGVRISPRGRLMFPLFNDQGELSTIEYVDREGDKKYHTGGKSGGCGWWLGDLNNASKIYLAEGFATAATIFEETGRPVGIAYSAANLPAMAKQLREAIPEANIVIVADHDKPHPKTGANTGLVCAEKAALESGCNVIMPPEVGQDANDFKLAGGNLKELLGEDKKRMVCAEDMTQVPSPVSWLIKGWVQAKAMVMAHGPSGCGKSFVAIDWMCTIASGLGSWMGKTTKAGDVIYLCGEGHYGLSARLAAWKIDHNGAMVDRLFVSTGPSDLDKEGELRQVVQDIVDTGVNPELIVIDTLNRFMSGDENSAKDTRAFLDACSKLMMRFNCTVLIVHHTGLNQDAQGRARGSSAWKGALDVEISFKPTNDGLILEQAKSKDTEAAEPLSLELKSVDLPGWFDDDDEQVTSAVITGGAIRSDKESKQQTADVKALVDGWENTGRKLADGRPFVFRNEWRDYLTDTENLTDDGAYQRLKNIKGRPVGRLVAANVIEITPLGFKVIDPFEVSCMMVQMHG